VRRTAGGSAARYAPGARLRLAPGALLPKAEAVRRTPSVLSPDYFYSRSAAKSLEIAKISLSQ